MDILFLGTLSKRPGHRIEQLAGVLLRLRWATVRSEPSLAPVNHIPVKPFLDRRDSRWSHGELHAPCVTCASGYTLCQPTTFARLPRPTGTTAALVGRLSGRVLLPGRRVHCPATAPPLPAFPNAEIATVAAGRLRGVCPDCCPGCVPPKTTARDRPGSSRGLASRRVVSRAQRSNQGAASLDVLAQHRRINRTFAA